jgi:hypothetical protein
VREIITSTGASLFTAAVLIAQTLAGADATPRVVHTPHLTAAAPAAARCARTTPWPGSSSSSACTARWP